MAGDVVHEVAHHSISTAGATAAMAHPWALLNFDETTGMGPGVTVELGLANPAAGDQPAVRVWRREATPADDAHIILSWLRGNAITDRHGVDTDMLVQLFIEAAVNGRQGRYSCDGEFLATLSGAAEYAGSTASSQWCLTLHLAPEVVEATLAAIADSDPRWRYAIVAARDPESPAGRVRQRLLTDLDS